MDEPDLRSLIYEAAIVPERWRVFLDQAASHAGSLGGTLFIAGREASHSIVSDTLAPVWSDMIAGGWDQNNPRRDKLLELGHTDFTHDRLLLTEETIKTHPWFTEFCAKWNLGGSFGTLLDLPSDGKMLFTLERSGDAPRFGDAEIRAFTGLRADLGRSIDLTSKLVFQQYSTTTGILNALGVASAVVNHAGKLINSTALFDALMPAMFQDRRSGIAITSKLPNDLLNTALGRLRQNLWDEASASIPIPGVVEIHPPGVLQLLPIRGLAHDIVHGGAALIAVSTLETGKSTSDDLLRGLFDLTSAEARVAQALVRNFGNHKDAAHDLGLAPETVRSHSKSIYQKTGLSGSAALIALVGGIKGN